MAKATATAWGLVEENDGDLFLGNAHVIELGESGLYMVLPVSGGAYLARWIDEKGVAREKRYASRAAALTRARKSWGR